MSVYQHDCDECLFLGTDQTPYGLSDFYICSKPLHSLVVRYGNDGPTYTSAPYDLAEQVGDVFLLAKSKANQRGLSPQPTRAE